MQAMKINRTSGEGMIFKSCNKRPRVTEGEGGACNEGEGRLRKRQRTRKTTKRPLQSMMPTKTKSSYQGSILYFECRAVVS